MSVHVLLAGIAGAAIGLSSSALAGALPPPVILTEIRIDQPGPDNDEYFELQGPPGTSLAGVTFLVIGDGPDGSGAIEVVVPLGAFSIGDSGCFVVAEPTFSLGSADLVDMAAPLNFENADNVTHMLVFEFSGTLGAYLDLDGDCAFDAPPWTQIVDAIGLRQSGSLPPDADCLFAPAVGPDPANGNAPAHVVRCPGDRTWLISAFDPAAGEDTPGSNPSLCAASPCPADLNGDSNVDGADLALLLGAWSAPGGAADLDENGTVDAADLGVLLDAFGACKT